MTTTGPDVQPPAQPGQPYQAWGPGQQPATPVPPPSGKGGAKKWGGIAGAVVIAGGVAAFRLTGGFAGTPDVGDCVQMQGETDFEKVDCDSADAEYKVVGVDEKKQSYESFQNDPDICMAFADAEAGLWIGDAVGAEGTTYCAVPTS